MGVTSPAIMRIRDPQMARRFLFVSEVLIALAAVIAVLAVNDLGPVRFMLFLVVAQACIVIGIIIYVVVTVTNFLRHRGVSRMQFEAGKIIFHQGEPGDFIYSIINGAVAVIREETDGKEVLLAKLGPGEYFGEMALVSDAPRTATVRAITAVEVLTMAQKDFTSLYSYLPAFFNTVEETIQQRRDTTGR